MNHAHCNLRCLFVLESRARNGSASEKSPTGFLIRFWGNKSKNPKVVVLSKPVLTFTNSRSVSISASVNPVTVTLLLLWVPVTGMAFLPRFLH